jgi:6-phosphogluconolactonase
MIASYLRAVALSALGLLAVGCAGNMAQINPPPPPTPAPCVPASTFEMAYMLKSDGVTVSMSTVDSCTGSFATITPPTIQTGPNLFGSEDMVIDRQGRFLYVANLVSNVAGPSAISMYTINSSTGALTPTTPPMVDTGWFPQGIAIDPAGKFVYTANSNDDTISMFTINPTTGVLTPTTPPSVASLSDPVQITVDPSGRFVYAANGFGSVTMYTIDSSTGVLTPMTPASVHAGVFPFALTVAPSGKFAYVVDDDLNRVVQYTIDQVTGVLLATNPISVQTGNGPTAVTVDPTSKFAYVTNRLDNTLSMYTIDPNTGVLTANGVIATGSHPFHVTFNPSGKFLYVVNEESPASVYTVNSNGTLTNTGSTAGSAALQLAMH